MHSLANHMDQSGDDCCLRCVAIFSIPNRHKEPLHRVDQYSAAWSCCRRRIGLGHRPRVLGELKTVLQGTDYRAAQWLGRMLPEPLRELDPTREVDPLATAQR